MRHITKPSTLRLVLLFVHEGNSSAQVFYISVKRVLLNVKLVKTLQIFAYRSMVAIEVFIFIMILIAVSLAVQMAITQIYLLGFVNLVLLDA